jgi:anti-sigma B factor antagonist
MLKLRCLACGLTVPYKGSTGDLCPRCMVRERKAVALIPVSDQPVSMAGRSMGSLRLNTRVEGNRQTIVLSGELDVASAPVLEEALADACSAGAREVVLDMSGLEFMDSTGLRAILRGKARCEDHDCAYRLTPAQRPVEQSLTSSGVRRLLGLGGRGDESAQAAPSPDSPPARRRPAAGGE